MIRFGIVGAGSISQKFAKDIHFSKGAIITSIASRNLDKAIKFKNKFDIEYAFGSYEEMAKSDLIDAVYIATPHNFHKEQAILFMNNKKHVLCEKPISVNLNELNKMIQSAEENNVLLMEAMWTRFLPSSVKVREIVKSNILGKLKSAYLEFGYSLIENYLEEGRLLNPNLAGGSILDIGVYPIAFLMDLTDCKIKKINAKSRLHKTGVDIETVINFEFSDNSHATVISSLDTYLNTPAVFKFEKGTIVMEEFSRSNKIFVNDEAISIPYTGEGFPHQIDSFVETLNNNLKENPIMTYEESRKVMKVMDEVRKKVGVIYPFE